MKRFRHWLAMWLLGDQWPSTHAVHGVLLEQVAEQEAELQSLRLRVHDAGREAVEAFLTGQRALEREAEALREELAVLRRASENPFVCPNGHPVKRWERVGCSECGASVAYVPVAESIALREQLTRAHAALDAEQAHTAQTWADREQRS